MFIYYFDLITHAQLGKDPSLAFDKNASVFFCGLPRIGDVAFYVKILKTDELLFG
jgi:hypothetical protein